MKFGMPTLIELDSIEECGWICHELNLDFIEISMSLPQYTAKAIDADKFKETALKYGISYTIHLDENTNFSDFNTYAADAAKIYVTDGIALAKKLDVSIINMHFMPGEHFTLPDRKIYLFEKYRDHYLKSIYDFRSMCENVIGNSNIKICIENCNGYPDFQKEALGILLDSPVFGLTFDIGHNHSCGGLDEPYIMENRSKLCHIHLHDALGRKNHLPLGIGALDLNGYLRLAKERNCSVVIEVKTVEGLKDSVNWMKENARM